MMEPEDSFGWKLSNKDMISPHIFCSPQTRTYFWGYGCSIGIRWIL